MELLMPKIMLLEDDATMLSLLQTLLQMEGYQVVSMKDDSLDGILSTVRQEGPDLALIDVHLREINGLEVLRTIRQDTSLAKTRVVMSSGMECRSECLNYGADEFILKPYMPDDLIDVIYKTLRA
jgi:DNA-binding response OmpR family regulator